MGADLYLPTIIQACHERYGQAALLADRLADLVNGETGPFVAEAGQQLKEALAAHAQQTGEMDPALFDLVAETADLAQGEFAAAIRTLAGQVADLVRQAGALERANAPVQLAEDLLALLTTGPDESLIRRSAAFVAGRLLTLPASSLLRRIGQLFTEVLQGEVTGVLTLLVEQRLLPMLTRIRAKQSEQLAHLEEALAPLAPEFAAPSPEESSVVQALAAFHRLARALCATAERVQQQLQALLQTSPLPGEVLLAHLADAREEWEERFREGEVLATQVQAVERLRPLFVRTLPSLDEPPPADLAATPLQRTFGSLLEHHLLWHALLRLLAQETETVGRILTGEVLAVLTELCRLLVLLLVPDREDEPELPEGTGRHLSLSPGIRMVGADLMGYHFLQITSAARQAAREQLLRAWVEQTLCEEPLTAAAPGLPMRFWRLLGGDAALWAEVLATRLREILQAREPERLAVRALDALLEQLLGLLHEQPQARLSALLTRMQVPPDSPLAGPARRLLQLVQGEIHEEVSTCFAQLLQEVDVRLDWPEDRRRDLRWLLGLGRELLRLPAGTRLEAVLRQVCEEVMRGEQDSAPRAALREQLADPWPTDEPGQSLSLLALLTRLEAALPEEGPPSPGADPRRSPTWKLRLLHELLQAQMAADVRAPGETPAPGLDLLRPVVRQVQRLFCAWLFPPEGYFRDPYNDASIFWIALGCFWPALAPRLVEPVPEPDPAWEAWLPPEQVEAGLGLLPLSLARQFVSLLAREPMHLPERAELERWGRRIIRVDEEGPYSLQGWHAFFARRRRELQDFLQQAIARGEPILCSL